MLVYCPGVVAEGGEVVLDFELRPEDLKRLMRWVLTTRRIYWMYVALGLLFVVLGTILAFGIGKTVPGVFVLAMGLTYLGLYGIVWLRAPGVARRTLAREGNGRRVQLSGPASGSPRR